MTTPHFDAANQPPADDETNAFAGLAEEIGLFDDEGDDDQSEGGEPVDPPAEPAAPAVPDPTPAPTTDAGVPVWNGQQEAGRAFADMNKRMRDIEDQAAYWRGQAEALARGAQPQAPAVDTDPEPQVEDFEHWTEYVAAARAWDRRQVEKEFDARIAPMQQQQAETARLTSYQTAAATLPQGEFEQLFDAATRFCQRFPSAAKDADGSANPGLAIVELGRMQLAYEKGAAPAAPAPSNPAAPAAPAAAPGVQLPLSPQGTVDLAAAMANPAIASQLEQLVLRNVAERRAQQGATPPASPTPPGPRGVGPGAGAPIVEGGLTPDMVDGMNPQALLKAQGELMASFLADD